VTGAVGHLDPDRWARANRALVAKALSEFSHERLLEPRPGEDGRWEVTSDDREVTYRFHADRMALDHWRIDADGLTRERRGEELPLDALALALELRGTLSLEGEQLGLYLEELSSTLSATAFKLAQPPMSAGELADADYQTIEARMTEGHPCFVANSGRLGFDATDYLRYAPEAGAPVRLMWVAGHRDGTTFSSSRELGYDELLASELGPKTLARFEREMAELGLDLADYLLIPVHPWQWQSRLAVTFAADVARRRLVCLGYGDDEYRAQQSIRTFFNVSDPARYYVKTSLSVVNMGFLRGLSAAYMEGTPAINDWVSDLVDGDEVLAESRFSLLRERASVGYRSEHYEDASTRRSPYPKMLAALWRESPIPVLEPGERIATMASLLHVDADGRSFAAELIERSGLEPREWLRRYLDAYLKPLVHCFYAYDLVFMPHGENIILVLEDWVPTRVLLKDIAEEAVLMDPDVKLPPDVERIRAEVPDELKALSILTDVVDCFFRFLNAILVADGTIREDDLWQAVGACIAGYQEANPQYAERFERHDLFADRFALSCLNRLQLRDSRQMVDLQDPAGSLQLVGELANPIADYAVCPTRPGGERPGSRRVNQSDRKPSTATANIARLSPSS
jgi:siderophore synthetase component